MREKILKRLIGVFGYFIGAIVYLVIRFQNIDKTELRLFVDNWQVLLPLFAVIMLCTYLIYDK